MLRKILILQHPQEPREERGSAPLIPEVIPEAKLRVGLSWPNLKKAWGGTEELDPKRFAVLYLGTGNELPTEKKSSELFLIKNKKWIPFTSDNRRSVDGIILLDGTWSQAKAMWWRNSWLLKCQRIALLPSVPSKYGKIRKEPRKECLSTIEALAAVLNELGEDQSIIQRLIEKFEDFLKECQTRTHVRKDHRSTSRP